MPTGRQCPPSPGAVPTQAESAARGGLGQACPEVDRNQSPRFVVSEENLLSDSMLVEAREASDEDLLVVHTRRYLNELKVQGLGPGGLLAGRNGQRRGS